MAVSSPRLAFFTLPPTTATHTPLSTQRTNPYPRTPPPPPGYSPGELGGFSSGTPLPHQVSAELKKMVAFIKQEAEEKAREIRIKADEEFSIEKSKLVRQETSSIDSSYERKFKSAELSQQIARSSVTNKTRLKVLAAQQELLDGLFERAREKLGGVSSDEAKYEGVLKNLTLEGMYLLNESQLKIRVREKDVGIAKKAIPGAEKEYKEKLGREVKVEVDEDESLPAESAGGVWIIGFNGRINVNNTLEERLKLMESESLPAVRNTLFGPSPNRKFYD